MPQRRQPHALPHALLVGAIVLVAAHCYGPPRRDVPASAPNPAEPAAASAPSSIVRLLDLVDAQAFHAASPSTTALQEGGASPALLREEFDGVPDPGDPSRRRLPPDWSSGVSLLARGAGDDVPLHQGLDWMRDPASGATAAVVTRDSIGLVRDLALAPSASARVRVRMRALGGDVASAGLELTALQTFVGPVPPLGESNRKLRVAVAARAATPYTARLDPSRGQEWQEVELHVSPLPRRAGLRIALLAGEQGALVDRVEVTLIAPWESALAEPGADAAQIPWRRFIRCGTERADSLLLPPGASAELDVVVPSGRARFEALVAALAPPETRALKLAVRVNGETIGVCDPISGDPGGAEAGGAPRFLAWTVSLERLAGRRVRLGLAAEGAGAGVLAVGAPLLLGTPPAPEPSPDRASPPNLLLISIDTLRADHVHCYGAAAQNSPHIDGLAAAGTRFQRVDSASSWTLPSHATIFTGQPPLVHGAEELHQRVDAASTPSLATRLALRGFATAAFTGGGLLDATFGFAAGFDRYSTRDPGRDPAHPGRGATADADPMTPVLDWLEGHADQPFFLFVHSYVVHNYLADDEFLARVPPPPDVVIRPELRNGVPAPGVTVGRDDVPALRALYVAALAQADERVVGRLLAALDEQGLSSRTLVALVSDHGEQWYEHGRLYHGFELWSELTQVPWILRGPGVPAGEVVERRVSHMNVAPTLLARMGVPAPELPGRDALDGGEDAEPALLSCVSEHGRRVDALVLDPWKLVRRRDRPGEEGTLQLFRRDLDPGEQHDLAAQEPARTRELARQLEEQIATCEAAARLLRRDGDAPVELTPELEKQLRELGYIH